MVTRITVGVVLFVFASISFAGFTTGNELYEQCSVARSDQFYFQQQARCAGYVSGVFDEFISEMKPGALCLNSSITRGQVIKIFVAYADKNPRLLNHSANYVVSSAIYNAFKCQ